MRHYIDIDAAELIFVSDAHFRDRSLPGEAERRDRFLRFLSGLPDDSVLFLLGDIFDFYFEYKSVALNRFYDIYNAISSCRVRNIEIHFLGGNHDYWVGDFFQNDLGIQLHTTEICVEAQNRRLVLAHGDLVMPRDWGYKILKSIIRNRVVIGAARWIHPDMMFRIASRIADGSRAMKHANQESRASEIADYAHQKFFARGNDGFVMGHVHHPLLDTRGGNDFLLLGDWIEHFTYGSLRNGRLALHQFTD